MGRQIPVDWNDIPDSMLLPKDMYLASVDSIDEVTSQAGNLMYKVTYKVAEPKAYAGVPLYDYFVIGTPDDPDAKEPQTWVDSTGVKRLKRLAKSTMVPLGRDMSQLVSAIQGQRLMLTVDQEEDDGSRNPQYKGVKRNRITGMSSIGSRPIGGGSVPAVDEEAPAAPRSQRVAASPTLPCPYCGDSVLRSEYAAHRRNRHPEED